MGSSRIAAAGPGSATSRRVRATHFSRQTECLTIGYGDTADGSSRNAEWQDVRGVGRILHHLGEPMADKDQALHPGFASYDFVAGGPGS